MDYETSIKIRNELSSGELLLWSGRPRQGILLRGSDVYMIPFSLLWGGFAFFWEYSAYKSGAPPFFLLFGGFFTIIGIYFIFGRFVADSMKRKGTYYGVTHDRVLILSEFPTYKLKSLNLRTFSDITLTNRSDGSGSIIFGTQHTMTSRMDGISWPGMEQYQSPMFEFIENAKTVYEIIRDEQKKSS